jgi:hypothetical protein
MLNLTWVIKQGLFNKGPSKFSARRIPCVYHRNNEKTPCGWYLIELHSSPIENIPMVPNLTNQTSSIEEKM